MLLMSLVCPRELSPECETGLLRPEMLGICMLGGENVQPMRFKTHIWWFRHRFDNATTLCRDFQNATGVRISTQTIRNQLHDAGLRSRRPAIRVPLTQYHVQMRLASARNHVTWTQNDWAPVLFTDESRFCVDFTDRRARVWRIPNKRFAPVCSAEHDRFGGGSVMVWAGISAQGKTDLHVIDNGTMTALRYINEILDVYVRPYTGAVGENFILMDDNARAHRAASPINISNKPQSSVSNGQLDPRT